MFSRAIFFTAVALSLGTAVLIVERRRGFQRRRILQLEQQIALAKLHQELSEKRLAKLFEAVLDLRTTTDAKLGELRNELNRLLTDRPLPSGRSAA